MMEKVNINFPSAKFERFAVQTVELRKKIYIIFFLIIQRFALQTVELRKVYIIFFLINVRITFIKLNGYLSAYMSNNIHEMCSYVITLILLMLSGDIESNPGPNNDWSLVSYNVCGLKNKVDLVLADFGSYDVIALTESHL